MNKNELETRGRPSVMTPEIIKKLEEAFTKGLNKRQACLYVDISEKTLYAYLSENAEFSQRIAELQDAVKMHAKLNVEEKIVVKKDLETSKWYLERRDSEFANKTENKTVTIDFKDYLKAVKAKEDKVKKVEKVIMAEEDFIDEEDDAELNTD